MESTSFAPRVLAELRTLGPVDLRVDGVPRLERRRKSLALLAFLARHAPARLRRADLAALLWPASPDERARQSLRQALAELRNALGDAVQSSVAEAWIAPEALTLDVAEFERDMDVGHLAAALARDTGPFLAGFDGVAGAHFDLWLAGERARIQARTSWLLAQLLDGARSAGDRDAEIRWAAVAAERLPNEAIQEPTAPPASDTAPAGQPPRRSAAPVAPLRSSTAAVAVLEQSAALEALTTAWGHACHGGAEAVLLQGDAGLGKSHVLEQFVRAARLEQPQSVTLVARALDSERRQSGAVVRHLLSGAPATALTPADEPAGAAGRLLSIARRIAGAVPLLVVVDDATLADDASQEAIGALVQAPPAGTLVVLAARPLMLSDVKFRGGLHRNGALRRVSLAPFTAAATDALLRTLLPLDESLLPALAARLCDERLGNPGLIETTLATMMDEGYLVRRADDVWRLGRALPARLPITADVRERTRRLMPRLSSEAREVLEAAAIPGDAIELALLPTMVDLDARALAPALDELVARRLLRSSMRGAPWLEFTSGLVRHAVLDQMVQARRRALQRTYERAVRHRQGDAQGRLPYPRPAGGRSAFGLLRSTLAAAGLLS